MKKKWQILKKIKINKLLVFKEDKFQLKELKIKIII